MRVIFVPVADRPECVAALHTAFILGQSVGASVIGCHIRPHRNSPITLPASLGGSGLASDEAQWQAAWDHGDAQTASLAARKLFTDMAEHHGYDILRKPSAKRGAVWMQMVGSPQKVIAIMGPISDLLVVSRPTAKGSSLAQLFLSASLLNSSRPVLVLPQSKQRTIGRRICIAWNQNPEVARTVAAAMPLLAKADRVVIVTCGAQNMAGPKASHLASYLKYWGIESEHIATKGQDAPKEILACYEATNSDLLLMGAYSRSRITQLIFGSVTDYMLKRATIPVLMQHT